MNSRMIGRVWSWFKRRPSRCLREVLVKHYSTVVAGEAARLHRKMPASVDIGELMSDAAVGLLDAIDRFDPGKNCKFETFARPRIRGAMMDGLRQRDPVSRTTREMIKKMETAANSLRTKSGVEPTPEELSRRLGMRANRWTARELEARHAINRSLSGERVREGRMGGLAAESMADKKADDPARAAMRELVREHVTMGLSREEKLVILLYYYEGMTMREIGMVLELSESRVSQIHSGVLKRLRARLHKSELMV